MSYRVFTGAEIEAELAARLDSPARFFSSKETEDAFGAEAEIYVAGFHRFAPDERFDCGVCGEGPEHVRHRELPDAR